MTSIFAPPGVYWPRRPLTSWHRGARTVPRRWARQGTPPDVTARRHVILRDLARRRAAGGPDIVIDWLTAQVRNADTIGRLNEMADRAVLALAEAPPAPVRQPAAR